VSDSTLKKPGVRPSGLCSAIGAELRRLDGVRLRSWLACLAVILFAFSFRLYELVRFAIGTDLYSHILLIPFVSLYLIGLSIRESRFDDHSGLRGGVVFFILGLALLLLDHVLAARGLLSAQVDRIALSVGSLLAFLASSCFVFLGTGFLRKNAFALAFLVFMIPFPTIVEQAIEVFFQRTSAEAAALLLGWSNVPVLRDGMIFRLPGIVIEVAKECSGIRSSFVLFITSLVAGSMLLRTPGARTILTLAVIPLGIIRNGFRILTISLLCVHVGPEMIDSPIHHRGGPLFFALSLVPFFGLLILLRKWEKKRAAKPPAADVAAPAPERGLLP
jgi:exosortase C (VPDSG-CTERM-specific)